MNLDIYLFQQIHNLAGRSVFLDAVGIFFAAYFQYLVVAALLIFLFLGKNKEDLKKNRVMVALIVPAVILSRLILTEIIRWLWFRPRPFVEFHFSPLIYDSAASFPSGHAAFFFALAATIYFFSRKFFPERSQILGWLFFGGSFLITLARVYAGVHYPSDILAGAIVGIFSGWLVVKIYLKYFKSKPATN